MHKKLVQLFINDDLENNDVDKRNAYGYIASLVGIVSNFILFIMKYVLGYFTFSVSIKADAFNNLFDSLSSLISLLGFKVASKPADLEHPFGHARFEIISDLFVGLIITIFGFGFTVSSIDRITVQEPIHISMITVILLIVTTLVKIWQGAFNKSIGEEIESSLLITTAQDSINDVLINLTILIGLVIQSLFNIHVDGILGLLLSLYIIFSGLKAVSDSIKELIGRRVDTDELLEMRKLLDTYDNILGYHDLIVHKYGPYQVFATVHIEVDANLELLEAHNISEAIESDFLNQLNINLVVHPDPLIIDDPLVNQYYQNVKTMIKTYDLDYTMHDFRLIKHHGYNIIKFDLVVTLDETRSDATIKSGIKSLIWKTYKDDKIEIVIDRNYIELEKLSE